MVALAACTFALIVASAPARAAEQPGDACPTEGVYAKLGSGYIRCVSGTWQPSSAPPGETSGGTTPASGAAQGSSPAAKIFRPVGVALSQDTFGSSGKQVADATAFRLPDGRVRLFAFVNSTSGLPGLRVATSTSAAGTRFADDGTDPFPGTPVGQPRAFSLGGNSLRLFFVEAGNVGTAVSSDGGQTFTRQGPVITSAEAGFEPGVITVIRWKGAYRAYFSNLEKPGVQAPRVMRTATSADLLHWTMGPSVVTGGGSHPFAVTDGRKVALYYTADRGSSYGIFVSTSSNGVTFGREKLVMAGAGDPDILPAGKGRYLMYYGADLGASGFGVKVAESVGKVIP